MTGHPKFSHEDFVGATLAIIAERDVSAVTVAAVSERVGSPTGSFYHRFASRDVLNCCSISGCALAKRPGAAELQNSSAFGSTVILECGSHEDRRFATVPNFRTMA